MPNNSSCLRHRWGDNFKDMTHTCISIFPQLGNTIALSTAIDVEKNSSWTNSIEMAKKQVFEHYKWFSF